MFGDECFDVFGEVAFFGGQTVDSDRNRSQRVLHGFIECENSVGSGRESSAGGEQDRIGEVSKLGANTVGALTIIDFNWVIASARDFTQE